MFENVKTVMIVKGDGREAKYAQLLFQLIGRFPCVESSQPVTEAEYKDSSLTVDQIPNGKMIFFGNGKEAVLQGGAVTWKYNRFGMKYGWLGNRCVITADPNRISVREQSDFADYYNSRISDFLKFVELKKIGYSKTETLNIDEVYDAIKWKYTDNAMDYLAKAIEGYSVLGKTFKEIAGMFERSDLWERQYELLVCEYILNGFERFMNEGTEKDAEKKIIIVHDPKDGAHAHLLNNLIRQYSRYDVAEFTEKMFVDNAKTLSSKNRIIFLGQTKAFKERWLDLYQYRYDKYGMRYGWFGNQAFIYAKNMEKSEIKSFKEEYEKRGKEFEDSVREYEENKNFRFLSYMEMAHSMRMMWMLPGLLTNSAHFGIGVILEDFACTLLNNDIMNAELQRYQYQLLLREFVFNSLEDFMEGT